MVTSLSHTWPHVVTLVAGACAFTTNARHVARQAREERLRIRASFGPGRAARAAPSLKQGRLPFFHADVSFMGEYNRQNVEQFRSIRGKINGCAVGRRKGFATNGC